MYTDRLPDRRLPRVPIERRVYAFLIDFVSVWLLSSLTSNYFLEFLIFLVTWLILRVIVVEKNRGQSLGRWALDIKVIDGRFYKLPTLLALAKREGIICFLAFLAMIGLKINFANGISMVLLLAPLVADCGVAIADEELNQAFHDRIADTIVIQSRRGFSLDLRLKRLFTEIQQTIKQRRKRP